jgi:hypothetical protein
MKIPEWFIDWIAWRKYELDTAWGYFTYFFQFATFESFAMLFTLRFNITGLPSILMYVVVPPVGIVSMLFVGRGIINLKVQEKYAKICQDMNPDWKQFMKQTKEKP